jgi:flagellar biosynthesis/type III secretory pathway protein FliH
MTLSDLESLHSKVLKMDCYEFEMWFAERLGEFSLAFDNGYDQGYSHGSADGYESGYENGLSDGENA